MEQLYKDVLSSFRIASQPVSCERYGNGHINQTFLIKCADGSAYILQKINDRIFKRPDLLMRNICSVCEHIASKSQDPRSHMTVVQTLQGENLLSNETGYWRVYEYIKDSVCLDKAESPADFYQSACGFGTFQRLLSDFDASTLYEPIADFHNTPKRYEAFCKAFKEDPMHRAAVAEREIAFALEHRIYASVCTDAYASGKIPLRVTHNDTKLNNVLLDKTTRKALCVIDLDTVMPGLALNDFGDSIRFGASSALEDEPDLDKVFFVPELYKTYAKGFVGSCGGSLTQNELELMPWGAILMTLECGIRFLADYLEGDVYFHINRPDHNLLRARTQFKLVSDMLAQLDWMTDTVLHV